MPKKNQEYQKFVDEIKNLAQEGVKDAIDKWNEREKQMLPIINIFYQKKLIEKTWWLVIGTWVLAIATIVLALVTYLAMK